MKTPMMMHTGEKPYIFHILCCKSLAKKNSFKSHKIIHIERMLAPVICLKSFKYTYDLEGHKMLHGLTNHLSQVSFVDHLISMVTSEDTDRYMTKIDFSLL